MERSPNNNDEVIRLVIKPGNKVSKRVTLSTLFEERPLPKFPDFDASLENEQEPLYRLDLGTLEGIVSLRDLLDDKKKILDEWQDTPKEKAVTTATYERVERIKKEMADILHIASYQMEAISEITPYFDPDGNINMEGQSDETIKKIDTLLEEIEERGLHISDLLERTLEEYDNFLDTKEGWWDKDIQKAQGFGFVDTDTDLKQVWGDQNGPIGVEPGVIEKDDNKERKGWWQSEYKVHKGVSDLDGDRPFTQRGEIVRAKGFDSRDVDRLFVSRPVIGSLLKGKVRWSRGGLENNSLSEVGEVETAFLEYQVKVQQLKNSFGKLHSVVLANGTDADIPRFNSFTEDFWELENILNRAEAEYTEDGEIKPETKDAFDSLHSKLLTGVAYFESLDADRGALPDEGEETDGAVADGAGEPVPVPPSFGEDPPKPFTGADPAPEGGPVDAELPTPISDDLPRRPFFPVIPNIPPEIPPAPSTADPAFQEGNENLRVAWLEAKRVHEEKHTEYHAAAKEYYEGLSKQAFLSKQWMRMRASFGFKPQLPEGVTAMRDEMFAATAAYNQAARALKEHRRETAGKTLSRVVLQRLEKLRAKADQSPEDQKELEQYEMRMNTPGPGYEIEERYHRLLARTTLLNTFNAQLDLQKEATDDLAFKASGILTKYGKTIRFAGAAVIGGLTGGVAGGAYAIARVLASGAVAGVATSAVGEWQDSRVNRISEAARRKYLQEVSDIESDLKEGNLSKEDLEKSYTYLQNLYYKVDRATQVRIMSLLATAIGSGLLVGAAMEGVMGSATGGEMSRLAEPTNVDAQTPTAPSGEAVPTNSQGVPSSGDTIQIDVSGPSSPESSSAYVAQRGDNLWDVMEGQTNAGVPGYLDNVAEGDRQKLIALITERVNEDAALRSELGFGATANDLQVGAEVDVERLNQLAEEIAREKNIYLETPVTAPAEGVPQAGVVETVPDTGAAATAEVPVAPTEVLVMREVVPDRIIEFARQYDGGYTKFEADFQKLFVGRIQGPAPADSLLGRLFGGTPNSADAFKVFGAYPVAEFNQLATLNQAELAQALAGEQIDMRDYLAWRDELAKWQEAGLVINPKARFSDVAEAAFINSLSQPRGT